MKRLLFLPLVAGLVALLADEPVNKLNGAFRQTRYKYGSMTKWGTRDSVTVVKVFRDGYWLTAFYDDKRQGRYVEKAAGIRSFNGACGGTYELKGGKYVEKVTFYSWDSTAVGNTFAFNYKVTPNQYEQYGVMTSDKYKDYPINEVAERITATEPLKHSGLEGVWFMQEGAWGSSRFGEEQYKGMQVVKIFTYPMVVYAYYNPTTRQFNGAGGARYQFDGKTLTETNEFWSWQENGARKGNVETFRITTKDGQYVQEGWSGGLREVWGKAPAHSGIALKN